jgi:hypothetical protein
MTPLAPPALLAATLLAASVPAAAQTTAPTTEAPATTTRLPMRLALQTEGAVGVYPGDFYNHLVGVRLDLVFSPHVSFGAYIGYANLKGKEGRSHDVLPYAQVEYLTDPLGPIRIPFRFASGYLPRNGPVARFSTGLAFRLTPALDLVTELLAPMIWVTHDQMVLSMNVAVELAYRF